MDEELTHLIEEASKALVASEFFAEKVDAFCARHEMDRQTFAFHFARSVALRFVEGSLAFWPGNYAMNRLAGTLQHDFTGFPWHVFLAFDAGEFMHSADLPGTISWQAHTLPDVMQALVGAGIQPQA